MLCCITLRPQIALDVLVSFFCNRILRRLIAPLFRVLFSCRSCDMFSADLVSLHLYVMFRADLVSLHLRGACRGLLGLLASQ
jgi:hypothetical protein